MFYKKKWYSGVVIDMEENVAAEWSSEDDVPLTNFSNLLKNSKTSQHNNIGFRKEISFNDLKNNKDTTNQIGISSAGAETMMEREPILEIEITDDFVVEAIDADMSLSDPFSGYDSDADPPYRATCEVYKCKREVFSYCHRCLILLCFDHFENYYDSCNDHSSKKARHNRIFLNESTYDPNKKRENNVSERYAVEGSGKEGTLIKVLRVNKQKVAKSSEVWVSNTAVQNKKKLYHPNSQKKDAMVVPVKGKREFIVRHTKVDTTKQKTSNRDQSRRQNTIFYYLRRNNEKVLVCKKFLLGTLGISERTMRTALKKVNASGIVEPDKRGGRQSQEVKKRDFTIHKAIEKHINKFPKIESHYCRAKSTREYLHPDLTISKIRQRPYDVIPIGFEDFIDFKKLFLDLRILKSRETDDAIKWNDIMEVKVSKLHPDTLFFKSSHNQHEYSKITLKRQKKINLKTVILRPLNEEPNKIGKAKYEDLMSLCQGVTPVVKIAEYRVFYASLPHTDN
ncbi:hypothetical protein JTB14_003196 [Gonioctena quinquepunctata]|nr:hypothetical protein JTB14_003196 [Gonioctena quinquepunctata]